MDRKLLALSFCLMLGAALFAAPVLAQSTTCASHDRVLELLADKYGETRQSIAIGADNTVVETWANAETGTWTLSVTQPGGPTCVVASGHAYERLADGLPNTDQGV